MIDTIHIGAGSYPTPLEKDETTFELTITIKTSDIFPETWDKEEIKDYIRDNVREYLNYEDIENVDIEI